MLYLVSTQVNLKVNFADDYEEGEDGEEEEEREEKEEEEEDDEEEEDEEDEEKQVEGGEEDKEEEEEHEEEDKEGEEDEEEGEYEFSITPPLPPKGNSAQIQNDDLYFCQACAKEHRDDEGTCIISSERSEHLAEYRLALINIEGDDPCIEDRQFTIDMIDEVLFLRGDIRLIYGQPLRTVEKQTVVAYPPKRKAFTHGATSSPALKRVAGPSRRASSPASMPAERPQKKIRKSNLRIL